MPSVAEVKTIKGVCVIATSVHQLQEALRRIDEFIRSAVARAQANADSPTDSLRGLIISHDEVDLYLSRQALSPSPYAGLNASVLDTFADWPIDPSPLSRLITTFQLTPVDVCILLLTAAPELDRRYERLYAYLNDDISERRPTVNLMLNLLGDDVDGRFQVWDRLQPHQPLRHYHLLDCLAETGRQQATFLAHYLKVDQRILSFLLGDERPDERLKGTVRSEATPGLPPATLELEAIAAAMPDAPFVFMLGGRGMGQSETAQHLCAVAGWSLVMVDFPACLALELPPAMNWRLALREGYLANAALFLDGWDGALNDQRHVNTVFWSALMQYPYPVFISAQTEWEPPDIERTRRMLRLQFSLPDYGERLSTWENLLSNHGAELDAAVLDELATKFRFTHAQIARAVQAAADRAASRGMLVTKADLYAGAQAHAGLRLGHLAEQVSPRYSWDRLILPPDQMSQLRELTARARFAHIVKHDWGFGQKIGNINGISALFAGESGTGKTLAAEVVAHELGLVMYKIDLSAVVSKYIGETEKNLSAIFGEARAGNAILFFDEADALFGKRSEVKDARDRYANIEIAYLLQQIEGYDGVVILATNYRQNIDEAFTRRLDFLVDFPFPDTEYRAHIWRAHFPDEAPMGQDVDVSDLAQRYRLSGGNIRNVAVASAFLAAADGRVITMAHIRNAVRREHQKMGRLLQD